MEKENKTQFILRKSHLSLKELSAQTGLSEPEVAQILQKTGSTPARPSPVPLPGEKGSLWMGALLLALLTVLFYLPALKNGFVNWDDKDAILDNVQIRSLDPAHWRWMFTAFATGNWMPLTWLSFALNFKLGGLNPFGFHAVNVLLHALNTVLVFLLVFHLTERFPEREGAGGSAWGRAHGLSIAFITALLFGLHPIHVESVAWAIERKDVLYSLFYLSALLFYLVYSRDPQKRKKELWICAGLFALSLMSKPMAVTLPVVFLVLDFWPLERFRYGYRALLREKVPFFMMALLSVWVTMASHAKSMSYARSGVEFYWVLNAFRTPVFYLWKMAVPWGLSPYYPFPPEATPLYLAENFLAAAAVLTATVILFRRRRGAPAFLSAWVYYLATLAPVVGFIQTGSQAAADRYTYLPSLGFFILVSVGLVRLVSRNRFGFAAVTLLLAASLGILTVRQIGFWRDTQALWERVVQVYPGENADSYARLGAAYLKARRYDEALAAFSRASVIPPATAPTFHGLGTALVYKNRIPEAIQAFDVALQLDPKITGPRQNLWNVYERLGKHEEAVQQMKEALKVEPDSPVFYNNLGVSYGFLHRYKEARTAFGKAHRLDPINSEYLVNLATIYQWEGNTEKALGLYEKGTVLQPREPVYDLKMADLYLGQGNKKRALEKLQTAWDLNPGNPKVIQQMGEDFEKAGNGEMAQKCLTKAKSLSGELNP